VETRNLPPSPSTSNKLDSGNDRTNLESGITVWEKPVEPGFNNDMQEARNIY
jgi:hypothetical protein